MFMLLKMQTSAYVLNIPRLSNRTLYGLFGACQSFRVKIVDHRPPSSAELGSLLHVFGLL